MRAILLAVVVLGCACEDDPETNPDADVPLLDGGDRPQRRWVSEHFEYWSRPTDDAVCEEILDELEAHFEVMQSYLGFESPAQRIDYVKYRDLDDFARYSRCSALNTACFFSDSGVQAREPLHTHELIHAYLSPMGDRHRLLEEGLAAALSCGADLPAAPQPMALADAFDPNAWRSNTSDGFRQLYRAAQWFVAYLLNKHGAEPFMRWYEQTLPDHDAERAGENFERHFDRTLQQAWDEALAAHAPDTGCARAWECAVAGWETNEAPPSDACGRTAEVRTLHLEEPSLVVQHSRGWVQLGACPGTEAVPHARWLSQTSGGQDGEAFVLLLPEGEYFVSNGQGLGGAELSAIAPLDEVGAINWDGACDAADALAVDFEHDLTVAWARLPTGLRPDTVLDGGSDAGTVPSVASLMLTLLDTSVSPIDGGRPSSSTAGYHFVCADNVSVDGCPSCGQCTSACDSDVMASDVLAGPALGVFGLRTVTSAAGWVRVERTY